MGYRWRITAPIHDYDRGHSAQKVTHIPEKAEPNRLVVCRSDRGIRIGEQRIRKVVPGLPRRDPFDRFGNDRDHLCVPVVKLTDSVGERLDLFATVRTVVVALEDEDDNATSERSASSEKGSGPGPTFGSEKAVASRIAAIGDTPTNPFGCEPPTGPTNRRRKDGQFANCRGVFVQS